MTIILGIWLSVGTVIAGAARKFLGASWRRAIGGGFIWPTYLPLIAGSLVRYKVRRW